MHPKLPAPHVGRLWAHQGNAKLEQATGSERPGARPRPEAG